MKKILSVLALSAFMVPAASNAQTDEEVVIIPDVSETCTRSPILASGQDFCGEAVTVVSSRASTGRGRGRSRRTR